MPTCSSHLETGDLIVLLGGDVSVVVDDPSDVVRGALTLGDLLCPSDLLLSQGHAGAGRSVMLCGMIDQRTPTTSEVEVLVARLELHVLTTRFELALLADLERLLRVAKHTARVDHRLAQEPVVEIVPTVVDVRDVAVVGLDAVAEVLAHELPHVELRVVLGEAKTEQLVASTKGL